MPASLAYTYTRAEFRDSFSSSFEEWGNVTAGDRLPYLPEHLLHGEIGVAGERWRVNLAANYLDEMRSVAGSGAIPAGEGTDAVVVWDLSAALRVHDQVEFYARLENLTDQTYVVARRPAGARPGQPRSAFAGLRLSF